MTTRYIHSLNRSQPIMLSIGCSETAGARPCGRAWLVLDPRSRARYLFVGLLPGQRRIAADPTPANPNLAPLDKAPYHTVPVHPGDIGTKGGLVTDGDGRVLREDGAPIAGLYASGNCSAAVTGGTHPARAPRSARRWPWAGRRSTPSPRRSKPRGGNPRVRTACRCSPAA
ncbi:FAD-binding protein [Streptomyces sp. NRRL F-2580]|uniref:FAD-binding protein n=1 Tax=Streptomyces sp. NRRL F-2580 TaxID=1463841 RepID=UPI002D219533|nr:FAD-binding protein [Streptomyces sp. NRRL F-2580]